MARWPGKLLLLLASAPPVRGPPVHRGGRGPASGRCTWTQPLVAPRIHRDGRLHCRCRCFGRSGGETRVKSARQVDLDGLGRGGRLDRRDDDPDKLSAQIRLQVAAPDPFPPVDRRTGCRISAPWRGQQGGVSGIMARLGPVAEMTSGLHPDRESADMQPPPKEDDGHDQ
jgi:hypothetical protein